MAIPNFLLDDLFGAPNALDHLVYDDPVDFLAHEMYSDETGSLLDMSEGYWSAIVRELARRENGNFVYSTWVLSAIKKTGKTTIAAGIVLWVALRTAGAQAFVIGNDLKQADSRMAEAIRYTCTVNPRIAPYCDIVRYNVRFDNGSTIEAIPVDPEGESGMNPTVLAWTEAWGAKHEKHKKLWTEAALSPTKAGQSFKLIESYAGYEGESPILEPLYKTLVKPENERPEIAPQFYINGSTAGCWITERTMSWQKGKLADAYYADEDARLPTEEFRRIHKNEWGSSTAIFVPSAWWDACAATLPDDIANDLWVLALDAAVSDDCFAAVAVSKKRRDDGFHFYVRYVRVWQAPIDFDAVQEELDALLQRERIACIAYDETQLAQMAQHFARSHYTEKFDQGKSRLIADKGLHDLIRDGLLTHTGDPSLTRHILNANRKVDGESRTLRIIKRNDQDKIDAAVALSMACGQAAKLTI